MYRYFYNAKEVRMLTAGMPVNKGNGLGARIFEKNVRRVKQRVQAYRDKLTRADATRLFYYMADVLTSSKHRSNHKKRRNDVRYFMLACDLCGVGVPFSVRVVATNILAGKQLTYTQESDFFEFVDCMVYMY